MKETYEKLLIYWYQAVGGKTFWAQPLIRQVKYILRELFLESYCVDMPKESSLEALFYIHDTRKDVKHHFRSIYKSCPCKKVFVENKKVRKPTLSNIPIVLRYFWTQRGFRKWKQVVFRKYDSNAKVVHQHTKKIPLLGQLHLCIYLAKISRVLDQVAAGYFPSIKMIVVLSDIWTEENLLVEMAKGYSIPSICCQQGFFYDNPNGRDSSKLGYLFQTSDLYFLWGENTKQLYEKYKKGNKNYIVGNPFIKKPAVKSDKWCVVCDYPTKHKYNQELIDMVTQAAKGFQRKVDVRLHPFERDQADPYKIDTDICQVNVCDIVYDAVFCHTSTVLYTNLACDIPTFQYQSEYSKDSIIDTSIAFKNRDDLCQLIMNKEKIDYQSIARPYLQYIGREAFEAGKMVFQQIAEGRHASS